jgi:sirohydrochlorin ferrochelatase
VVLSGLLRLGGHRASPIHHVIQLIGRRHKRSATVQTSASGSPREQLSLRVARPRDPLPERLSVVLPPSGSRPGAEARRYRLLSALTQAILNATLLAAHPTLSELADRLRAAGVREAYIRAS